MSTVHPVNGRLRVMVKGAPDVLLSRCTHILDGSVKALTSAHTKQVEAAQRRYGGKSPACAGLRL